MKPPRPKRVSSAKPDTVNGPDSLQLPSAAALSQNDFGPDHTNDPDIGQTLGRRESSITNEQEDTMGSGSSMHVEPVTQGTYKQRDNYLTLSHAEAITDTGPHVSGHGNMSSTLPQGGASGHIGMEPQPCEEGNRFSQSPPGGAFLHPANLKSEFKEFGRIKKAPLMELKFKQSTFKGGSTSAVTLQRENFHKSTERQSYTSLASIFPQRGKYNFNKNNSFDKATSDFSQTLLKPTTILQDSDKFHQTAAPDITLTSDPHTSTMLEKSDKNTALLYGTLPNSHSSGSSSGSVSELLQKSKSRVRNSLRNLRFYSRNLTSEQEKEAQKPPQRDLLPPSAEFYDAILSYKDTSAEQTWMDEGPSTDDSGILLHHNAEHSTLKTGLSHHNAKHQTVKTAVAVEIPSVNAIKTKTSVDENKISTKNLLTPNSPHPSTLPLRKTPEQESIALLDEVIENHSRNLTSLSSMKSFITETKLTLGEISPQKSEPDQEPKTYVSDAIYAVPWAGANAETKIKRQNRKHATEVLANNGTAAPVTGSPKSLRKKEQSSKDQGVARQDSTTYAVPMIGDRQFTDSPLLEPALIEDQNRPEIRGVTPADVQIFSSSSPRKIPVTKGLSISDVLSQGNLSDILATRNGRSSSGSSAPRVASLHSRESFNFDSDSFDDSFVSTSGSQDLASCENHGDRHVLVSAAHVRKTGWLVTKHVLVSKRGKVEQATKRNWQKFWVNMKGGHLLFYDLEGKEDEEESPKLMLPVDGALVQAVPEHAKKDNVFCMSTKNGSVYLMQGVSQTEVDGWVKAIHTEAAVIFAMRGEDESTISKSTIEATLNHDIEKRRTEIDMDEKMKKMAELQMSLVSDAKSRRAITEQIAKWEENLEKNQVHVFRFRCYLSSLDDAEPPNPRTAMASACKNSKQLLSGMKLLNVSSLHALVNSREEIAVGIPITKPPTPKGKSLGANIHRSGSFNESLKPESSDAKSISSPAKSKKSNIFASLRGLDTWRGTATSGGRKKKQPRASVSGILSAFGSGSTPSSHSSTRESDEKSPGQRISERSKTPSNSRKQYSNSVFYGSHQANDYGVTNGDSDDTALTPGSTSEDDMLESLQNSNGGSLDSLLLAPPDAWGTPIDWNSSTVRVAVSTTEFVTVTTTENMTFKQLLEIVCQRKQLDSYDYFLVTDNESESDDGKDDWTFPDEGAMLLDYDCESLKILKKRMYSIELRNNKGFTVLPKAICRPLVVGDIMLKNGAGLNTGDQILTINGELTEEMSNADVVKRLSKGNLRLLVRTSHFQDGTKSKIWWLAGDNERWRSQRTKSDSTLSECEKNRDRSEELMSWMEEYLQKIVVPPPPIISRLQPPFIRSPFTTTPLPSLPTRHGSAEDIVSQLIVPAPDLSPLVNGHSSEDSVNGENQDAKLSNSEEFITELLKKSETVTSMCRQVHIMGGSAVLLPLSPEQRGNQSENGIIENVDGQRQLSESEKVYKVLHELVDTETVYVKDLECLLKRYLEPLHAEGFFVGSEMDSLLQNVHGMVQFQQTFLIEISQAFCGRGDESEISALNRSLLSVSSAFLQHAAQFKLYAVFSTCHTEVQDLLEQAKSNSTEFREFLDARNPKKQHSLTVESYLIKPIQRVLKYPLLLRELLNLSKTLEQVNSKCRRRLKAALQAMNGVARHINDFQTVYDEFGGEGFKETMKQAASKSKYEQDELLSLDLSELLCYCTTEWLNVSDEVGKLKKGNIMEMLVFVFRSAVVLLCRGTKRDKKKATTPQRDTQRMKVSVSDFIYMNVITRNEISVDGSVPAFTTEKTSNIWQLNQEHPSGLRTIYRLSCESVESKQRVVKTIEYVMKNCMRSNETKGATISQSVESSMEEKMEHVNARQKLQDIPAEIASKHCDSSGSSPSLSLKENERAKNQRAFFYKSENTSSELQSVTQPQLSADPPPASDRPGNLSQFGLKVLPTLTSSSQLMSVRHKITAMESRPLKTISPQSGGNFGLEVTTLPGHTAAVNRSSSFQSHRNPYLRSEFVTFTSAPPSPARSLNDSGSSLTGLKISTHQRSRRTPEPSDSSDESGPRTGQVSSRFTVGSPAKYNMVYGVSPFESKL